MFQKLSSYDKILNVSLEYEMPNLGELYKVTKPIWLCNVPGNEYYKKTIGTDVAVEKNKILLCIDILYNKRNFIKFLCGNEILYMPPGDFGQFVFWEALQLIEEKK